MKFLYPVLGAILLISAPIYLHAMFKFRAIIASERPDWLMRGGALRDFQAHMPFFENPNEAFDVVAIAFGSRWRELKAEAVAHYARRIRISVPIFLVTFAITIVLALTVGPAT
ncbi:MAG: hypothetical protein KA144_03495 [Xanthomonadaceae bacterium]|nr:hypothetical protein [Xanthomonadaceae bacterium]